MEVAMIVNPVASRRLEGSKLLLGQQESHPKIQRAESISIARLVLAAIVAGRPRCIELRENRRSCLPSALCFCLKRNRGQRRVGFNKIGCMWLATPSPGKLSPTSPVPSQVVFLIVSSEVSGADVQGMVQVFQGLVIFVVPNQRPQNAGSY